MFVLRLGLFVTIYLCAFHNIYGQGTMPCDSIKASDFCHSAPIICDIDCLDGFMANMPDTVSNNPIKHVCLGDPDPFGNRQLLQLSNPSWFAFVAGSSTIEFNVVLSNCTPGIIPTLGVQAGLINSCIPDRDSTILPANVFDCYTPEPPSISDFVIRSNSLIVNEVYYFVIDGYAGTKCKYTIDVINATQPFQLDDPDSLVTRTNELVDTVCTGFRGVRLHPNIPQLNIDHNWKITPPTAEYPSGTFRKLGYETIWNFANSGTYEISFYADNGCDQTDTITQTIVVTPLPNEVFDTVEVCATDFPFQPSLTEDPNGDGVIGWLGDRVSYPGGIATHTLTQINGCQLTQLINVVEISPKPAAVINLSSCSPITVFGTTYSNSVSNVELTIVDGTTKGCDSLVNLTIDIARLEGNVKIVDCDSSGLKVAFDTTLIQPSNVQIIGYQWYNSLGPIGATLATYVVPSRESYSVEVFYKLGNDTCSFLTSPMLVDPDDFKPAITAIDWSLSICDDDNIGVYLIQADQPIKKTIWRIPSGAFIIDSSMTQITVDFTGTSGGLISVEVENFCSGKTPLSFPVQVVKTPIAEFDLPTSICPDSSIILLSKAPFQPSYQYRWTLPNQTLVQSGSINAAGPNRVQFTGVPGTRPITLTISNGNCADTLVKSIEVLPSILPLVITCFPQAEQINFSWVAEPCASAYVIFQNNQPIDTTISPNYIIDQLTNGSSATIDVGIISNCQCSAPRTRLTCETLLCDKASINLAAPTMKLCEKDWQNDITLNFNLNATNMGIISWAGTPFISQSGVFDTKGAGEGVHKVIVLYDELGCLYSDSIQITLTKDPTAIVTIDQPYCIDETTGKITIQAEGGNGAYTYFANAQMFNSQSFVLPIGEHTVAVLDTNLCKFEKQVTIIEPLDIAVSVAGVTSIFESEIMKVDLILEGSELGFIDSIVWFINNEIYCRGNNCRSVRIDDLDEGVYLHRILIYYEDCILEQRYEVEVKPGTKVVISNAISANGDGTNDNWVIMSNDPTLVFEKVLLFDRWGNKILDLDNFEPAANSVVWNGTINGNPAAQGVYIYVIEYFNEFGLLKQKKGDLTIYR